MPKNQELDRYLDTLPERELWEMYTHILYKELHYLRPRGSWQIPVHPPQVLSISLPTTATSVVAWTANRDIVIRALVRRGVAEGVLF